MTSIPQSSPEEMTSIGKKTKELREQQLEPLNAETNFIPDADRNIMALSRTCFPENPQEQERYANKIKNSLKIHLKDNVTIAQLWDYLKNEYCQTTAIIEGILKFFAGVKGEKEINIEKFLKPTEINANPLEKTVIEQERENQIINTKKELSALLAEIKAGNNSLV